MRAQVANRNLTLIVGSFVVGMALVFMAPGKRPNVPELDTGGAKELIDSGALVIDVRELNVSAGSHIVGAMLIPLSTLPQRMQELGIDQAKSIVVYCNEGTTRGPEGTALLQQAGYTKCRQSEIRHRGLACSGLADRFELRRVRWKSRQSHVR